MDMTELMTKQGMGTFKDEQRDTFVNDADQVRQMGRVIRARIANTCINGDKPWSAKRRAAKVGGRFDRVAKLLEKAAAEVEAIDATYNREVLELPARRQTALDKKAERQEAKALTRQKARALTERTLAESAHGLAADPRLLAGQPPATAPQPVYTNPAAYQFPTAAGDPIPEIADMFKEVG